jgi:hypothetical protein
MKIRHRARSGITLEHGSITRAGEREATGKSRRKPLAPGRSGTEARIRPSSSRSTSTRIG